MATATVIECDVDPLLFNTMKALYLLRQREKEVDSTINSFSCL